MEKLTYNGCTGSVEFSKEDQVWHGKIQNIPDSVSYESETKEGLESAFREAVDDYKDSIHGRNLAVNKRAELEVLAVQLRNSFVTLPPYVKLVAEVDFDEFLVPLGMQQFDEVELNTDAGIKIHLKKKK